MRPSEKNSNFFLPIIDILLVNLALVIAFYWRYPDKVFTEDVYYLNLILFYNINWIFCSWVFKAYKNYRIGSVEKILRTLIQSIFLHMLLVAVFWVFVKGYYYSRQILITSYIILVVSSIIWRIGYLYYQYSLRKSGKHNRNVVIIGKSESAMELAFFFTQNKQFGYKFLGYVTETSEEGSIGNIEEFMLKASDLKVEEIYCLSPIICDDDINKLKAFADNNTIRLKIILDVKSFYYSKSKIDFYGNTPVLVLKEMPLDKDSNKIIKRIFDILFSLFAILFVFSWLFPIIAILIKIGSKGPVFYVQERSGKDKNSFSCFKFRSMRSDGSNEFKQATKNDSRITPIGAFIRKTSIDEMPQFFNVLIGNMSVVGPRPHPIKLDEEYRDNIDKYMSRHFVKPGITGLSQVMGYRGETRDDFAMKARVNLDNFYIERWSFFLDLKIIILTIFNVFKKEENAF